MSQVDTSWFPESQMMPLVDVDGKNTELEVFMAGTGRPVVLCHGWPEHAYSWRHQVQPLVDAGYQVIVPNQRGYGRSPRPEAVEDYDIVHLTGDLIGLLDSLGIENALFAGHDWGAIVVWNLAMMHPARVAGVINLSVPFMERGPTEWVGFWEEHLGQDFYIVHFNRQPGVADRAFAAHCEQFLRNMYRTEQWLDPTAGQNPGGSIVTMAEATDVPGRLIMSEAELQVFIDAFNAAGFTGGLNWYRNFSRNWEIIGAYEQTISQPTLMIYGDYDMVPKSETLADRVADLEVVSLPCGHWIQQEQPEATNAHMLDWMKRRYPASA